ncbi:MAG TPA: LysE family transporter [Steroidobacteraceae bacterium]|nr:LysE family transporter [Steroidobacteraceae bacterium]
MIAALLKGMAVGLAIAAPVGPIGLLCIRRTLTDGQRYGLASGLGAATADACYGVIAGFGLAFVAGFLVAQQFWLTLGGGVFLCYLGVRTALARPASRAAGADPGTLHSAFLSTLLLTLANPMTIMSFTAVFAGLGLGTRPAYATAAALVAGIFLGSALWWLVLSTATSLLRSRLNLNWLRAVNWVSAALLVGFGLRALAVLPPMP